MLPRFSNEVLSRGSAAVLPQNLSEDWLNRLQKLSDDFLDNNFAVDHCTTQTLDAGDPILTACVHEVLGRKRGVGLEIPADELAENVTIYALSITMETIRRQAGLEMTLPTLQNLLSIDRIVAFGKINPDFGQFLQRACIAPEHGKPSEGNWFQQLKEKILSRINAG